MSKTIFSGEIHFFKMPEKWQDDEGRKIINEQMVDIVAENFEDINQESRVGWISGYIKIGDAILGFGEVSECNRCHKIALLEDEDFQEQETHPYELLCSDCLRKTPEKEE